jgi:CspA family cold shock protein
MKDSIAVTDEVAKELAYKLSRLGTDPNEVSSALATLCQMLNERKRKEIGPQFLHFLDTVVREGRAVVRSGRTLDYYRQILEVCRERLMPYLDDPEEMAYILGWTARLMRFYRIEGQLERSESSSKRQKQTKEAPGSGGQQQGRVKFFRRDQGYGFIIPDGGGKDVYVNKSQLSGGLNDLSSGQQVTYEVGQGRKGPEARDVRLV